MATPEGDNPFWDFSLAVYARPGVAESCLALQEARQLDVNLLLFALWAGACGRRLEAGDFARLIEASALWQVEVVRPLRAVGRRLRSLGPEAAALGRRLQKEELAAERLEQDRLQASLPLAPEGPAGPGEVALARGNLGACLALYGTAEPRGEEAALLARLLAGAFPGAG